MGRPRILEDEKKQKLSVTLKGKWIKRLRLHGNYSRLIESLVSEYFNRLDKKE